MKRLAMLLTLSSSSMFSLAATINETAALNPCAQKRASILYQIDKAKQHGNDNRVSGLNKALREQEGNCTPESIRKTREEDVAKAQHKVAERERELHEARSEGKDAKKISKREVKLKDAQDDLTQAKNILGN